MSDADNGLDYIADIFGVSEEMRKIDENQQEDIIDFDEKVKDFNDQLEDSSNELLKELDVSKEPSSAVEEAIKDGIKKSQENEEKVENNEGEVEENPNIVVESESEDERIPDILEEVDSIEKDRTQKEEAIDKRQENMDTSATITPQSSSPQWRLESPDPKFDNFYQQKRSMLNRILLGGPLPFDRLMNELKNSSVDMSYSTFDEERAAKKMYHVQQIRNRVREIQMDCNGQYFLWERTIELMHGLLARTQYEKPAAKQEGLIYEHMEDMEVYFQRLKSLYRSAEAVVKNLDGSFETFSRHATIAMPEKKVERKQYAQQSEEQEGEKEETESVVNEPMPESLAVYDSLPDSPAKKNVVQPIKPAKVSWDAL